MLQARRSNFLSITESELAHNSKTNFVSGLDGVMNISFVPCRSFKVKGRSSAYPGRKLSMLQARGFNNFLSKDS
jgi:hypothetical protein